MLFSEQQLLEAKARFLDVYFDVHDDLHELPYVTEDLERKLILSDHRQITTKESLKQDAGLMLLELVKLNTKLEDTAKKTNELIHQLSQFIVDCDQEEK